jgi:hypothetical protein
METVDGVTETSCWKSYAYLEGDLNYNNNTTPKSEQRLHKLTLLEVIL